MISFLILLLAAFTWGIEPEIKKPSLVFTIFRHGDRTPVDPYPLDPYRNESLWPSLFGELTPKGMRQHYSLGKTLKKRYPHLFPAVYNPKKIRILSSDYDRSIMSAECLLAGVYFPDEDILPDINWIPIPVHSIPINIDDMLAMKARCPKYEDEMFIFKGTEFYKAFNESLIDIYTYVSKHTGRFINDVVNLSYIFDTLLIEDLYNFTLPEWTKSVYPDPLYKVSQFSFNLPTATPTLARLIVAPIIQEITNTMISKVANKTLLQMNLFSGHDTTIANILNALGLLKNEMPPYAASLIFELYEDGNDSYIQIYYQMKLLNIPNCGTICPLNKWINIYGDFINSDHQSDCGISPPVLSDETKIAIVIFSVIIVFMILMNCLCLCVRYKKKSPFLVIF